MKKLSILFISWLIPGSGYWFLQQKTKSILLLLLILPTFLLGVYMLDFSLYFLQQQRFYFLLSFAAGFPSIIFVFYANANPQWTSSPDVLQLGFLHIAVAALLNMLLFSKIYFTINKVSKEQ